MKKTIMILMICTSSFSLASCLGKKDSLMQLTTDLKKIQHKIEEKTLEEIPVEESQPTVNDEYKLYNRWSDLTEEEQDHIYSISWSSDKCFSCDLEWSKDVDPNLY